jgi:NMD protein affecting ribosome stability and mRNA decay
MKRNLGMDIGPYQGVLQLREPNDEIIGFARNHSEGTILKEEHMKEGIDMYFSSHTVLLTLAKTLKKKFTGQMKITKKLFTVDRITSKEVYRITVMFRPYKVKVGDVVKYRGEDVKVKHLGNKVQGILIKNGKKVAVSYEEI